MQRNELERLAQSSDLDAKIRLGVLFEQEGNHHQARATFANAAKVNTPGALRRLALNLLSYPPRQQADGLSMLKIASDQGDAEARHICAMIAVRDEKLASRYSVMLDYLAKAAELDHKIAQAELRVLANMPNSTDVIVDWNIVRSKINIDSWSEIPPRKSISSVSRLEVFEGFLKSELCDWIISNARPRLERAKVLDHHGRALVTDFRTNSTGEFPFFESDALFSLVQDKIIRTTGVFGSRLENASVLHYETGQEFFPHYDFIESHSLARDSHVAESGQRYATFLIYLNDGFEGGETDFPLLDVRYRGKKGDAIMFWNLDSSGNPDRNTWHAGLAPTKGEKWLFSQWLREPIKNLQ